MKKTFFTLGLLAGPALAAYLYFRKEREITFYHEIYTDLDADEVWRLLERAFVDSRDVDFWPNELEELRSNGLELNSKIAATYYSPYAVNTYHYSIIECRDGHTFTYSSMPDHPLDGGGTVELVKRKHGTLIRWYGLYTFRGFSPAVIYMKLRFMPGFFERLKEGLAVVSSRKKLLGKPVV